MRKLIVRKTLGILALSATLFAVSCSSPSNPNSSDSSDSGLTPEQEEEIKKAEEKERLYNNLVQLVSGKTFKETNASEGYYVEGETIEWKNNGYEIFISNNQIVISKLPDFSKIVDFTLFNIKEIKYEYPQYITDHKEYEVFFKTGDYLNVVDSSTSNHLLSLGYEENNYADYISAYYWSSGEESGSGASASDIQSFIQGIWNYTSNNNNCTVNFNNGNCSATWAGTTVSGTYTVSNGKISISFTKTAGSTSHNYSGDFTVELGSSNNTFTLKAGSSQEAFSMFFGATLDSITFTK